jgi:hypothetical protein
MPYAYVRHIYTLYIFAHFLLTYIFRQYSLYICGPLSSSFANYAIYNDLCMYTSYIRHICLLTYSFRQPSILNAPKVDQDNNISSPLKLGAFLLYKTLSRSDHPIS